MVSCIMETTGGIVAPAIPARPCGWVAPSFASATTVLGAAATLSQSEPVYVAALVACAGTGLFTGIRWYSRRRFGWSLPIAVAAMALGTWSFLAVEHLQHAARSSDCRLKQLALALHNYHDANGHLPGPTILSSDGKPLLSWRVAILPFIDEDGLYKQFHLDEPWDSPHNLALLQQIPRQFSPYPDVVAEPTTTLFQAFVGPGTAFERGDLTWRDFTDGTSTTILLVEAGVGVPWTKPADLPYDPHGPLPQLGKVYRPRLLLPVEKPEFFRAAMADGSSRSVRKQISDATLRAAITRNGADNLGSDWEP